MDRLRRPLFDSRIVHRLVVYPPALLGSTNDHGTSVRDPNDCIVPAGTRQPDFGVILVDSAMSGGG